MVQVQYADIEVKPSRNYQSVSFSFRLVFESPVSLEEAKFESDLAYAELKELADKRLDELAGAAQQVQHTAVPNFSSRGDVWAIANKPNGAGSFRYIPTTLVSRSDFISLVEAKLAALGIDPNEVTIFDDRGGERGIESGGGHYSAGKVKAKPDSKMVQAMGGKAIVANVDFAGENDVKVSLTKDGKTAIGALTIASQFATMGATPF